MILSRREFIKIAGVTTAGFAFGSFGRANAAEEETMNKFKLGFGMMRLPSHSDGSINFSESCEMVDEYLGNGGKYFDTSYVYQGGHNEETVRKVLVERHKRDEFELATKLPTFFMDSNEKVQVTFEEQLRNLGVDYLDRYLLHSIYSTTYDSKILAYDMFEFGQEMKRQGKIREFGFSFHDTPEVLDRVLNEHPETDFVQLVVNYYDWDSPFIQSRRSYEVARRHDIKVFVMEPVKGGLLAKLPAQVHNRLQEFNPTMSDASYGFRFAAGLDGVDIILSGMSSIAQVKDNVKLAKNFVPLTAAEQNLLFDSVKLFKESGPLKRSNFSIYENICENKMPVDAVLDAYNSIMVQLANGCMVQAENGYYRGLQFLAGRGMGNHIAERFAKENFRVVLVARRQSALDEYTLELSAKGYEVFARSADVSDSESLGKVFSEFSAVDVLFYNAAYMQGGCASEVTATEATEHFKVDVAGAIDCVQQVLPKQIERGSGAIIFTGGLFGVYPNANFEYACMSMDKAALRALAQMLNAELKDKGIFAGIVQIMGVVGSSEHFAPKNIADAYWKLYAEKNSFEYVFD